MPHLDPDRQPGKTVQQTRRGIWVVEEVQVVGETGILLGCLQTQFEHSEKHWPLTGLTRVRLVMRGDTLDPEPSND